MMLHEVLFYCHILYCVLPNMCIMYLLIHDYGIVLALSYGLIGGVLKSQQECALHVSSPCS